mmetsp:Transcript_36340/g.85004  ORF Transcript_36340/g.85004 Transcript_36340/m.85004 type:complete len:91 (-) Transcript_36340:196-468(-)
MRSDLTRWRNDTSGAIRRGEGTGDGKDRFSYVRTGAGGRARDDDAGPSGSFGGYQNHRGTGDSLGYVPGFYGRRHDFEASASGDGFFGSN